MSVSFACTVTNQLKHELVIDKRGPPFRALLWNKFQWTPEVEATIDWNLHGQTIRNTCHKATFIKFIFGHLPVGWRVHKYDPKYSETCASCKHLEPTVETIAHLHECPSESRTKWFVSAWNSGTLILISFPSFSDASPQQWTTIPLPK